MPNDARTIRFGQRTVGDLTTNLPGATAVFPAFKLNHCYGGEVTFEDAAQHRELNPEKVARELGRLAVTAEFAPEQNTATMIAEILGRYHEVHRRELPELVKLALKIEVVPADHDAAPLGLADALQDMIRELEVHMKREELILFPAMLRHDHDDHGTQLRRPDEIANGFTLPEGVCRSWQALSANTRKLAEDLMERSYLENTILFPRFDGERANDPEIAAQTLR